MYALCVSGTVNKQGFVWKFFYALYINFHSFIHSFNCHGKIIHFYCQVSVQLHKECFVVPSTLITHSRLS